MKDQITPQIVRDSGEVKIFRKFYFIAFKSKTKKTIIQPTISKKNHLNKKKFTLERLNLTFGISKLHFTANVIKKII